MKRSSLGAAVCAGLWLSSVVLTSGQTAPAGPPMAEQVFKNIQVLKGIPVNEFMGTMGMVAGAPIAGSMIDRWQALRSARGVGVAEGARPDVASFRMRPD